MPSSASSRAPCSGNPFTTLNGLTSLMVGLPQLLPILSDRGSQSRDFGDLTLGLSAWGSVLELIPLLSLFFSDRHGFIFLHNHQSDGLLAFLRLGEAVSEVPQDGVCLLVFFQASDVFLKISEFFVLYGGLWLFQFDDYLVACDGALEKDVVGAKFVGLVEDVLLKLIHEVGLFAIEPIFEVFQGFGAVIYVGGAEF
jgi:hypothetical protein